MDLIIRNLSSHLAGLLPEPFRAEVERELSAMYLKAGRLGAEVLDAEMEGLTYAAAVQQDGKFPMMARVHHGFLPVLFTEFPAEMQVVFKDLARRVEAGDARQLRQASFIAANPDRTTAGAALLRFLLFQACRMNLYLLAYRQPAIEVLGVLKDMDEQAEASLRRHLRHAEVDETDTDPLDLLVVELLEKLSDRTDAARREAAEWQESMHEVVEYLVEMEEVARALPVRDGVLLRNRVAESRGDEQLGAIRLQERHPDLFPSPEAVDQRWSRLRRRAEAGKDLPVPRTARLIDIIQNLTNEEVQS